jgi:hypothetical protein
MTVHARNLIWMALLSLSLFVYYGHLDGAALAEGKPQSLIVSFVILPLASGILSFIGLRGQLFDKAVPFVALPLLSSLLLVQESKLAASGLQWLLLSMQLPYWAGGVIGSALLTLSKMRWAVGRQEPQRTTNPSPQPKTPAM